GCFAIESSSRRDGRQEASSDSLIGLGGAGRDHDGNQAAPGAAKYQVRRLAQDRQKGLSYLGWRWVVDF
ncbi:MAG: hypothetical protein ABI353_09860, partial [Isosphaeraceae bacterium]